MRSPRARTRDRSRSCVHTVASFVRARATHGRGYRELAHPAETAGARVWQRPRGRLRAPFEPRQRGARAVRQAPVRALQQSALLQRREEAARATETRSVHARGRWGHALHINTLFLARARACVCMCVCLHPSAPFTLPSSVTTLYCSECKHWERGGNTPRSTTGHSNTRARARTHARSHLFEL